MQQNLIQPKLISSVNKGNIINAVLQILIIVSTGLLINYNYSNIYMNNTKTTFFDEEVVTRNVDAGCTTDDQCVDKCEKEDDPDDTDGEDFTREGKCSDVISNNKTRNVIIYIIFAIIWISYILKSAFSGSILIGVIIPIISIVLLFISIRKALTESPIDLTIQKPNSRKEFGTDSNTIFKSNDYLDNQQSKSLLVLLLYSVVIGYIYSAYWSNSSTNPLLSSNNVLFIFSYFSYTLYLFLDSKKTIETIKNTDIINKKWIISSIMYLIIVVYVLLIGQSLFLVFKENKWNTSTWMGLLPVFFIVYNLVIDYKIYTDIKRLEDCDVSKKDSNIDNQLMARKYLFILLIIILVIVISKVLGLNIS